MRFGLIPTDLRAAAAGAFAMLAACGVEPQSANPHADLVAQLAPEDVLAADFRQKIEVEFPAELRAEPKVLALERECPGAIESMVEPAQSLMRKRGEPFRIAYRAALEKFLVAEMTAEDARQATAFYASDLGRRMMAERRARREHDNAVNSVESSAAGGVDSAALARDQTAAAEAGNLALGEADRRAIDAAFDTTTWGQAMRRLRSAITRLQARIYNANFAGQQAAIEAAMERGLTEHCA